MGLPADKQLVIVIYSFTATIDRRMIENAALSNIFF